MKTTAIILAGGQGSRLQGDTPKQFLTISGKPVLEHSIVAFTAVDSVSEIVLVAPGEHIAYVQREFADAGKYSKIKAVIIGGNTRRDSTLRGLPAVSAGTELVAIHDAARPAVHPDDIARVIEKASHTKAAILAAPVTDTIKQVTDMTITATPERAHLYAAQTPQVFDLQLIKRAHAEYYADPTDDAQVVEALGQKVSIVVPKHANPKLTHAEDLALIESILASRQ